MPQLLVRNLEPALVKRLRHRASDRGISVEEAHRQLLREALTEDTAQPANSFTEYLSTIPSGPDIAFDRAKDLPREVDL